MDILPSFYECFGFPERPAAVFFAPGRVNLIGDHTDYQGGFVLPFAIPQGTWLAIRETDDGLISLASAKEPVRISVPADRPLTIHEIRWLNYPLGILDQFMKRGVKLSGMELWFDGDLPIGAGLASSASLEMVTAMAVNEIVEAGIETTDLAILARQAEHDFAGVECGIMDQYAIGMAEKNHALFLNCHTLEHKLIPVLLPGYRFILADSGKRHSLVGSFYQERVQECLSAVEMLRPVFGAERLGEISFMEFFKLQDHIGDEVIRRRARHVISENQRVLNGVSCLLKSDLRQFGALMDASHDSLRDNFEVTGFELDTLVEEARNIPGVLGSRMTGSGFGGCTISLVTESATEQFVEEVGHGYSKKTGLTATFWLVEPGSSARKIS